jgi:hypothetical protein
MIQGFYHVCMINDYRAIVQEQWNQIKDSGLLDAVDKIHVGCLGPKSDFNKVVDLIYCDKVAFYHDISTGLYEFFTLKILEYQSSISDFNGFYIHTKAVTWPNHEGGKYWRDYMNYYNIIKWRDCLDHLQRGYETCGVKLQSVRDAPAFKMHYSGNFFWFKSQYARTLTPISQLNLTNRLDAEMWIGSGCPIAATFCQMFVDYNSKGKFVP